MDTNMEISSKAVSPYKDFLQGIWDSMPIMLSYFPVAFTYGLTSVKLGFMPIEAVFFSCIIYAGASQFVITALLSNGASLLLSGFTVMMMDVRHVLYGPSLKSRLLSPLKPIKSALWSFGLTDEVFVAATAKLLREPTKWSESWMMGIALFSWLSWVMGTIVGAYIGDNAFVQNPWVDAMLSFMLPALFLTFLLASLSKKYILVMLFAVMGSLVGILFASIPVAILLGILSGCTATFFQRAHS